MSHEVCNALQILVQCTYLQPDQRAQLEGEAMERIRVAVREIMPDILDIPPNARPAQSSLGHAAEAKRKYRKASRASAGLE
jgi:hypothetical protein